MNVPEISSLDSESLGECLLRSEKILIWSAMIAVLFLTQFAINIDEFPFASDLLVYMLFAVYLVETGQAAWSPESLAIWVLIAILGGFGIWLSPGPVSGSSLLLLLVLYLPFSIQFRFSERMRFVQYYIVDVFIFLVAIVSVIACLQFVLVNFAGLDILTNISLIIPDEIHSAGLYTYIREEGGVVKANGYFLKEASSLSFMTAVALVLEYFFRARKNLLLILAAGLLASVSGTGFLIIAAAFILPTSKKSIPGFLLMLAAGLLVIKFSGDIAEPNMWLDRLSEFQTEGTSGYSRFVAPIEMVERGFENGFLETLFGNGSGSYHRALNLLDLKYEISDPTLAKLLYEYGVVGTILITLLVIKRIYSGILPLGFGNCILYAWLIAGGSVLKPDIVLLMWMFSIISPTTGVDWRRPFGIDNSYKPDNG